MSKKSKKRKSKIKRFQRGITPSRPRRLKPFSFSKSEVYSDLKGTKVDARKRRLLRNNLIAQRILVPQRGVKKTRKSRSVLPNALIAINRRAIIQDEMLKICTKRRERRRSLFSYKNIGKGKGGPQNRRLTIQSKIKCTGR